MAIKICLDAGHAGVKYNQSPVVKTYYESTMNWKLTNLLASKLRNRGFEVILTRNDINKDLSVYNRGAASKGCDLFLSIHSNACNSEAVDYPVVYRAYDNKHNADVFAIQLAQLIAKTMGTRQAGKTATRKNDSGGEWYGVMRGARAVNTPLYFIVEHSFHTNTKATKWLMDDANLEILAEAEADYIESYYGKQNSTESNDEFIWKAFKSVGYSDVATAGIMGNLFAESGLKPNNLQNTYEKKLGYTDVSYTKAVDNGTYTNFVKDSAGYGLAQWTFWSRKEAMLDYIKSKGLSIGDLEGQVEFLINEMNGYKGLKNRLNSCTSVRQASDTFMVEFERPANQSESVKAKRAEYGQKYFNLYHAENKVDTEGDEDEVTRYKRLSDIPESCNFRNIVDDLMTAGLMAGDGSDPDGNEDVIDVSHDMVRMFIFNYRAGIYDNALSKVGLNPDRYK